MELLQLRYFMIVAEQKNITKAAKLAFTSQSNISKQIAGLEEELNVRLLNRHNTGVELTASGERLFLGLSKLLPQFELLVEEVQNCTTTSGGLVRLGLCDSMDIEHIIPHFFQKLAELAPELEVSIELYSYEKILEKLALRTLDIAFIFSVFTVTLPDIQKMILNRRNPLIYFLSNHPLAAKENLCVEDFCNETFILFHHKLQSYDCFEVLPFIPHKIITANSLSTVFAYVQAGAGVTVLGQNQSYLGKKSLATLEVPTDTLKVGTDAIWIKGKNPAVETFVHLLKSLLELPG